jgi:protein TonB
MPQPLLPATDSKPAAGLPRWSRVAIPALIVVIALAVVFMTRTSVNPAKDSVLSATPPVSSGNDGASTPGATSAGVELFGLAADSLPETAASDGETGGPAGLVATESPLPVESLPVEPDEALRARVSVDRSKPAVRQEPEPLPVKPEPVAPQATVAVQEPAKQPEPVEVPVARAPAVVESEPFLEPAPVLEPEPFEEPEQTSEPEPAVPEPITRDPVVVRRVEPRVSEKDLKDGGGTVVLSVRVSSTGLVTRVLVEQGLPGSPLEAAAVAAVLRWRYEPALDRGQPVEASTTARFTFGD